MPNKLVIDTHRESTWILLVHIIIALSTPHSRQLWQVIAAHALSLCIPALYLTWFNHCKIPNSSLEKFKTLSCHAVQTSKGNWRTCIRTRWTTIYLTSPCHILMYQLSQFSLIVYNDLPCTRTAYLNALSHLFQPSCNLNHKAGQVLITFHRCNTNE